MTKIRTAAEARGLTEAELIHQLETGRLAPSAVFPALKDQLAFESRLEEQAAAERAVAAERAAREMVMMVHSIESERRRAAQGLRVRLNHTLRSVGVAAAHLVQALLPPPADDRESL